MRLRHAFAVLAVAMLPALAAAEPPAAATGQEFRERLPRAWCGTFRWDGSDIDQHVTIAFHRIERRADGMLEASGPGLVRSHRVVPFDIRAVIDPATRRIEMFESVDVPMSDYVTDGSHVGELAPDLHSMRLVWTTRGSGTRGAMELRARPARADLAQSCAPPSS